MSPLESLALLTADLNTQVRMLQEQNAELAQANQALTMENEAMRDRAKGEEHES